ncbi:hypothetical protein Tel_04215 [Candidatus Tenderia electrophaga]|jgi:hypothetical protein|uniref:Uncharacterized protein n=1 Tax=Candidatus Tenderia electrophaga TaxID=1748243 RepID=A0A0S2TB73_9GAMM|nr:hypothetical protein Tel_04215 [Candidatus Tenderia electrophaga]
MTPLTCVVPLAITIGLTACGGGGGGSSSSSSSSATSRGYTLPSEISAVPASGSSSAAASAGSFSNAIHRLSRAAAASGLPADSDYVKTKGRTFVEEPALEQFDIIETILTSLAQTNYADEVGTGAYQAVVSWEEDSDGVDIKQLQTWTVKSELVDGTHPTSGVSQKVNVIQLWIPETDPHYGTETLIKAQAEIYTSASVADDGSFEDYGEWDLNVYFDADPTGVDASAPQGYFAASARIDANGNTTLKVVDRGMRNEWDLIEEMKGVLIRSANEGYGVVQYPDWETCYDPNSGTDCSLLSAFPSNSAKYSYNGNYLGVQEGSDPAVFKDRELDGAIKMVHRYGLFYAEGDANNNIAEGENVEKKVSFGFPVRYEMTALSDNTKQFEAWGYYGAWQGRHELWGPEGFVVDDGVNASPTTFTKADVPPGQTAPTYTMAEFAGTFTKRNLVSATLDDIKGVPVQTWLNKSYELFYINNAWRYCADGWIDWGANPLECKNHDGSSKGGSENGFSAFDLNQLVLAENDQRWIYVGGDDNGSFKQYLYLDSDPAISGFTYSGEGFYETGDNIDNETGRPLPNSPAAKLTPASGDNLFTGISGQLFIQYTGDFSGANTGWVQKEYLGEDPVTNQPTFGNNDTAFNPGRDEEYYINAAGSNYIVKRKDAADAANSYDVKRELQNAANPDNTDSSATASILPAGTSYLAAPWNTDVKYSLIEDPADANYLLLEVLSDSSGNNTVGAVADTKWGLFAYDVSGNPLAGDGTTVAVDDYGFPIGQTRPVEFNWEKPSDGQNWGKQRFLKDSNGDYVILSNPITLNNVAVQDSAGTAKGTLSLQFDGWMHGMPDMYHELEKNGWTMTPDIAGKVVHIAAGTEATGDDGTRYFVKPLDTSLFLGVVTNFPNGTQPDISDANAVDLTSLPSYTAHNMGAVPTGTSIKYTEGKAVE